MKIEAQASPLMPTSLLKRITKSVETASAAVLSLAPPNSDAEPDAAPSVTGHTIKEASAIRVVHFEPVGWQRNEEFVEKRRRKDDDYFNELVKRRLDDLEGHDAVSINAALNSRRQSYNFDLLPQLKRYEKSGRIVIDDVFYDFSPPVHSVNPAAYVSWRPSHGGR
jgi:hypothetical protein